MKISKYFPVLAGPAIGLLVYLLLRRDSVSHEVRLLSAVASQTVVWWFLDAMSPAVAGLFFAALSVLLGLGSAEKIFSSFANPIIYFFLGGFFLAKALEVHGVAERILQALDSTPGMGGHPYRIGAMMIAMTALLSAFLNNTATAALVLPFAVTLVRRSFQHDQRAGVHLILGVAYAASLGGMITIFGTAPNMISLGILKQTTGEAVSFLGWMKYSLPVSIPPILWLAGRLLWFGRNHVITREEALGKTHALHFSSGAKRSLVLLFVAIILLILVSIVPALNFIGEMNAILIPALFLFVLPSGNRPEPLLNWKEAMNVDWGCLILFGSGLAMGSLMFSTGLAKLFGESLKTVGDHPHLYIVFLISSVVLISTFASNTASVTLLVPLALAVAKEASLPTLPTVLAVALAASFGLTLPVGTPPNALAYGTGLVSTHQMIRKGFWIDLMGIVLCILVFCFAF